MHNYNQFDVAYAFSAIALAVLIVGRYQVPGTIGTMASTFSTSRLSNGRRFMTDSFVLSVIGIEYV
jgi:hypothetical protein